jgi:hypothetical protein
MSRFPILRHPNAPRWTRAITPLVLLALAGACSPAVARSLAPPAAAPSSPTTTAPAVTPTTAGTVPLLPVVPETINTGPLFALGDSLTVGIEPYLPALLPGWRVRFDAQVGRTTAEAIAIVRSHPSELAPTVVVGLGTNDDPSPTEFAQHVDELMALLGSRRVLWVNLNRAGYESFNDVLAGAAVRYPNLQVVDWATPYADNLQDQTSDGIHATEAGYQLRAWIIASALTSPGSPEPSSLPAA